MIPQDYIDGWRAKAPWQSARMVEQDLVISRALVDLYQQDLIKRNLVFRGGTALNKLYIQPAARYSEDIDVVQVVSEPIGSTIDSIREALGGWLGEPKRKTTERGVKLIYRYPSVDTIPAKLKIEINTTEHFHVLDLVTREFDVQSDWFLGQCGLLTYQLDELMGSKLRALYQRRKGRDLFDLWYVLSHRLVDADGVIFVFSEHFRRTNESPITRRLFEKNLREKMAHRDFLSDMSNLLMADIDWDIDQAYQIVHDELISRLS